MIVWVLLVWIASRLLWLSRSARATTGSPLAARGVLSASVWGNRLHADELGVEALVQTAQLLRLHCRLQRVERAQLVGRFAFSFLHYTRLR